MAYGASAQAFDTERSEGQLVNFKMGAEKIYKGTMCMVNAAGFVVQVSDTATGDCFAGVAAETVDNSAGSAGDKVINLWQSGVFTFKHAGAARTDVGLPAFASLGVADAGQTVKSSTEGTHAMMVGKIVGVSAESSATRVRVRIDGYTALASAETAVIGGWSI
jgi:hypothetical protein